VKTAPQVKALLEHFIAAAAWLCCITGCRRSPALPMFQIRQQHAELVDDCLAETLGLHKMQARRRIIRMTRGGSSINLMAWSGVKKNHWQSFSAPLCNECAK